MVCVCVVCVRARAHACTHNKVEKNKIRRPVSIDIPGHQDLVQFYSHSWSTQAHILKKLFLMSTHKLMVHGELGWGRFGTE